MNRKPPIRRTQVLTHGTHTRIRDPLGRLSRGYVVPHGNGYIVREAGEPDRMVATLEDGINVLCARIPIRNTGSLVIAFDDYLRA